MQKRFDEAGQKEYAEGVEKVVKHLDKILVSHSKNWIAGGEKISIGDFAVASWIWTHIHNDSYPGGAVFTTKGKEILAAHPNVVAYTARLEAELAGHLATHHSGFGI